MKSLDGGELAGYIKERQAKQVRALRQSWRVFPKLAIIRTSDSPVIGLYVRLKRQYGEDILIDIQDTIVEQSALIEVIETCNKDESIHGIIVQLPIDDVSETQDIVAHIAPQKDVDGLGPEAHYISATAQAIDWLLVGYGVELVGKQIAIVGQGMLVGAPLGNEQGLKVQTFDENSKNISDDIQSADIIVTATGMPRLITSDMVKQGAAVVDAGTASENGQIVGDVDDDVRERDDITITPKRGGVGPLTIASLFDNVITAARKVAEAQGQKDN
jgi:methylenetetrahydrofolate dehydrogenase (NADP+) / methenyltetrahydrofolate cyclohydrolase